MSKSTARNRRERENEEFNYLARLLPLPSAITCQLDKASVVRLTTSYLHLRTVFPHGLGNCWMQDNTPNLMPQLRESASNVFQTLDGFLFVLSPEGKIMYITETASVHLGLSQVELTGNLVYDYVHPNDHGQLHSVLQTQPHETDENNEDMECPRNFFIRMKCVLAKRNAGLTDQGFKVVHCSGYLKMRQSTGLDMAGEPLENVGLVAVGHTLPATAVTEIRLSPSMFMFRASLDFKLVFLDSRVSELTGFDLHELLDMSIYELTHQADTKHLAQSHATLLEKHQVTTQFYRLLVKGGGWLWIQSQLTLIQLPRASRPACIVAISHVLSHPEYPGLILNNIQSRVSASTSSDDVTSNSSTEPPSSVMGAYSSSFYGLSAASQLISNASSALNRNSQHIDVNYPTSSYQMHDTVIRCAKQRKRLLYDDAVTGERRYCLRNSDITATGSLSSSIHNNVQHLQHLPLQDTSLQYPQSIHSAQILIDNQLVSPVISNSNMIGCHQMNSTLIGCPQIMADPTSYIRPSVIIPQHNESLIP